MAAFEDLPEGCIAAILSRTTPLDAGRLSLVSKNFHSASDFDDVWNSFLTSSGSQFIDSIISHSPSLAKIPTKKALFMALCDHPVIIDNGRKSFQLHKKSGKKCYMLAARSLEISWRSHEQFFNWWTSMPESRFPEVVELLNVCWLDIRGKINTLALSPNTHYETYLVFNMINGFGFEKEKYPVELSVDVEDGRCSTKIVILVDPDVKCRRLNKILDSQHNNEFELRRPSVRSDKWLETKIGEFFNSGVEDREVQMSFTGIRGVYPLKRGFFVEGIEIRPKEYNLYG
ncbi:putative F-box protein PP2-B12 [Trifolium pratense]|uniref:putative F-box protein PP2-B12 n=1 Tax=Trifolium pratense TaxID=57577 RepID=UPI001E692710|nr:putative F-box protein PP2-B12 [Trifolium pratense]